MNNYDVIIVGAGHNGLIAACYLAKEGKKVLILEANNEVGGATKSNMPFKGLQAIISSYSYLVSLMPSQIISDLKLNFETIPRRILSYTPYLKNNEYNGLLVHRNSNENTESFQKLTGSNKESENWNKFYERINEFASIVQPTLLKPLPTKSELKNKIPADTWNMLVEQPIGKTLDEQFSDDIIKGLILTDGLIGTFCSAYEMQANICFLYHIIGGEWKVPKGGMGALVDELYQLAIKSGVDIRVNSKVKAITQNEDSVTATLENNETLKGKFLLSNAAPQILESLLGENIQETLEGSQVKINMLLKKLPEFKSGINPKDAFVGTLHINESFSQLQKAYNEAKKGVIPEELPLELYCHSLSDHSVINNDTNQSLTAFILHTPAKLFDENNEETKRIIKNKALDAINQYLVEPIENCFEIDQNGNQCLEIKSPIDLQKEIALPRGNIFHKNLSFPFKDDDSNAKWGVETKHPRIFICGAGAIRGGGVSGIPGHNAAMAILEQEQI